jgi:transmembrane sensor
MGMKYPTARDEQAAYWYLKLQEPDVSAEEIDAALEWQADPENSAAFQRVEAFGQAWARQRQVAREVGPRPEWRDGSLVAASSVVRGGTTRRILAAASVAIAAVGGWFAFSQWRETASPPAQEYYSTTIGQIRTVRLADGSELTLGGATSVRVELASRVRRIVMGDGEALFKVAKDSQRPFIVEVPNGSAQAVGTMFNVHRGPDDATVTVLEGTVRVMPPIWQSAEGAAVRAGAQVSLSSDGRLGAVTQVDPQDAMGWHSGRLVFRNRTLRSIVADLNRYSSKPVMLAAADAAEKHLTATVKLSEMEEWLRILGPAVGVDLVENEHGLMLVPAVAPAQKRSLGQ